MQPHQALSFLIGALPVVLRSEVGGVRVGIHFKTEHYACIQLEVISDLPPQALVQFGENGLIQTGGYSGELCFIHLGENQPCLGVRPRTVGRRPCKSAQGIEGIHILINRRIKRIDHCFDRPELSSFQREKSDQKQQEQTENQSVFPFHGS